MTSTLNLLTGLSSSVLYQMLVNMNHEVDTLTNHIHDIREETKLLLHHLLHVRRSHGLHVNSRYIINLHSISILKIYICLSIAGTLLIYIAYLYLKYLFVCQ